MPAWGLIKKDRCIYCGTEEAEDLLTRQTPNSPKKDHICLACVVERGMKILEQWKNEKADYLDSELPKSNSESSVKS